MRHRVSAVIPTTGRESLARAIASALAQEDIDVQVIVVDNGIAGLSPSLLPSDERVKVYRSDPRHGANGARQLGIDKADHALIALLDDDDSWKPDKLRKQLDFVIVNGIQPEGPTFWVCGSGVEYGAEGHHLPRRFPDEGRIENVAQYLFELNSLRRDYPYFQTSTYLFPAKLASRVPWDERVRFHQDWQWAIGAQAAGAEVLIYPGYLTNYGVSTASRSIASRITAEDRVSWARTFLAPAAGHRVAGDFVIRTAMPSESIAEAWRAWRTAVSEFAPGVLAICWGMVKLAKSVPKSLRRGA